MYTALGVNVLEYSPPRKKQKKETCGTTEDLFNPKELEMMDVEEVESPDKPRKKRKLSVVDCPENTNTSVTNTSHTLNTVESHNSDKNKSDIGTKVEVEKEIKKEKCKKKMPELYYYM